MKRKFQGLRKSLCKPMEIRWADGGGEPSMRLHKLIPRRKAAYDLRASRFKTSPNCNTRLRRENPNLGLRWLGHGWGLVNPVGQTSGVGRPPHASHKVGCKLPFLGPMTTWPLPKRQQTPEQCIGICSLAQQRGRDCSTLLLRPLLSVKPVMSRHRTQKTFAWAKSSQIMLLLGF